MKNSKIIIASVIILIIVALIDNLYYPWFHYSEGVIYRKGFKLIFSDSDDGILGILNGSYIISYRKPLNLSFYLSLYLNSTSILKIWFIIDFNGIYIFKKGINLFIPPAPPFILEVEPDRKYILINDSYDLRRMRYAVNDIEYWIKSLDDVMIIAWFDKGTRFGSSNNTLRLPLTNDSFRNIWKSNVYETVETPIIAPTIILFLKDGREIKLVYNRDFNSRFILWEDLTMDLSKIAYKHESEECRIIINL